MRWFGFTLALALALFGATGTALAQGEQENRLREALRRATADLRATQDGQSKLQADLAQAQAQRDQAQRQVAALQERVAGLESRVAAVPVPAPAATPAAAPPPNQAELDRLRAALREAQAQAPRVRVVADPAATQQANARVEAAQQAAAQADAALKACIDQNRALLAASTELLRLHEAADFRWLLLASAEPVLGLSRVRLENMVQDLEDKLRQGRCAAR
jgi:hypothetical protein